MDEAGPGRGWSGGQWSLLRALIGLVLIASWTQIALDDGGWRFGAPVAAAAFLVGWQPHLWILALAAAGLVHALPCPWTWLAVGACVSLALPGAPYGSWPARRRPDPGGGWRPPTWHPRACLGGVGVVMSVSLCLGPLQSDGPVCGAALWDLSAAAAPVTVALWTVVVAVLAPLSSGLRWLVVVGAVSVALSAVDPSSRTIMAFGAVVPVALAFDPAWLPRRDGDVPLRVFFDGGCGLCHGAVRLLVAEDAVGRAFRFAPLGGASFEAEVGGVPPESLLVRHPDGTLQARSVAVITLLRTLGGFWGVLAWFLWLVPRPLRDFGYDLVARVRHRLFAPPSGACPVGAEALMDRFDP